MATETLDKESAANLAFFEHKVQFEKGPGEVKTLIDKGAEVQIIDLLKPEHFAEGHIPGSLNVLLANLEANLFHLDREVPAVVYCYDYGCRLATHAALKMARAGFAVSELVGGYEAWTDRGYKVETMKDCGCSGDSCEIK
jgi:rhodanese-related sulfurtransferase